MKVQDQIVYLNPKDTLSNTKPLDATNFINNSSLSCLMVSIVDKYATNLLILIKFEIIRLEIIIINFIYDWSHLNQ